MKKYIILLSTLLFIGISSEMAAQEHTTWELE